MKARITKWAERFEAFSLRERALISGAVLVLIYMLWDAALMSPEHLRQKNMVGEMYALNQQMAEIDAQVVTLSQTLSQGESAQMTRRLQDMREALTRLDKQQQELTLEFIRPDQMAGVLRGMLGAESGLTLTALRSLGAQPLFPPQEKEGKPVEAEGPQIFKHGMRVTFEGDYFATVRYLQSLETMPWRFYWDGLEYQVLAYPKARVAITVHTLSLEKGGSVFKHYWLILVTALLATPALATLEDPTRPPTSAAVAVQAPASSNNPRWVLSSTLVSPQRRTAVINDRLVAVGDRIGGARVADIQADSVRLRVDGREVTLMMLNSKVKQPTKHKRGGTP